MIKRVLVALIVCTLSRTSVAQIVPSTRVVPADANLPGGKIESRGFFAFDRSRCANVLIYGADVTGKISASSAFSAAVAANLSAAPCIYFPAGTYRFATAPSVELGTTSGAAISIIGDGPEVTKLKPDSGVDGLRITFGGNNQSYHVRDMSILASGSTGFGIGVQLTGAGKPSPAVSDVSNVTIRGSDGYNQTKHFTTGINLVGIANTNFTDVLVDCSTGGAPYAPSTAGTAGISLAGSSSAIPVQYNLVGVQLNFCTDGLRYGNFVQGVQIVASNFTGNYRGIFVKSGQVGNDQLAVMGSQFNNGGYDIAINSLVDGLTITGNFFYVGSAGGHGVLINLTNQFSITGNAFTSFNPGQVGVAIGQYGGSSGVITGNQFNLGFRAGVWLQHGSQNVNVQSNSYSGPEANVLDNGTSNTVGGGSE